MGGSSPTIGYRYFLGVHAVVCVGPVDEVSGLYFDGKLGWSGSVTANATVPVRKPSLFGGEKKEGGVVGDVDVMMGDASQGANAYLQSKIGGNVPGFRGVLSLVFRGVSSFGEIGSGGFILSNSVLSRASKAFYWSAMNPYIKPVSVKLKRILQGWTNGVWYSAKAAIGVDMNPVHIIYQALTEPTWGAGLSSGLIDDPVWRAAADTLYTEGFGLSLIWVQQQPVEDFIKEILRHIDAALYFDSATGKFVLKLNRADYTVGTLPIYGPDEIAEMQSYRRAAWGETTNEIVVTFTDANTEEDATIAVQDLSNIRIQQGVVSSSRSYAGIRTAALAYKVAERDLRVVSTPLAAVRFTINRKAWTLNAGSVFRLNWPDYGLTDVVFRVTSVDRGVLSDGTIQIEAIEDVFALPSNSYGAGQGSGWADPGSPAATITNYRIMEATYFDLTKYLSTDVLSGLSTSLSYPIVVAEQSGQQNSGIDVYTSPTATVADFISSGTGQSTPTLVIPSAVTDKQQTTIVYGTTNGFLWDGDLGSYAYWDEEIILIENVNAGTNTLTIKRGVLDSIPTTHAVNSKLWVWDGELGALVTGDFVRGETTHIRTVGVSSSGPGDLTAAADNSYVQLGRWSKPWPPANVKINGAYAPSTVRGNFTITWNGRNRIQQTVDFVSWYDAHVAPEPGTTYLLEIYDGDTNILMQTVTGLTVTGSGGSYTYPGGTNAAKYKLRFYSVRSGIRSQYYWEHTADIAGYGLNYDLGYGGFTAGVVLPPLTTNLIPIEQYTSTPYPMWMNGAWRDMETSDYRTSTDNGVTWFVEALAPGGYNPLAGYVLQFYGSARHVVFGNGVYMITNGSAWFWFRRDGGTWTGVDTTNGMPNAYTGGGGVERLAFDGTKFILVKNQGKDIWTATDPSANGGSLANWTHIGPSSSANQLNTRMAANFIIKTSTQYVALGSSGGQTVVSTSSDLLSWSATTVVPSALYFAGRYGAYFNGAYFSAVPAITSGTDRVVLYRSTDFISWTEVEFGALQGMVSAFFVVLANAIYLISSNHVARSTDGVTFTLTRSDYQYDSAYLLAKRDNLSTEPGPSYAIICELLVKEIGGKLISIANPASTTKSLLYPSDATNGTDIGVLGAGGSRDLSNISTYSLQDSGFLSGPTQNTNATNTGFVLKNNLKRYFEIKLVSNDAGYLPANNAPLIHLIGAQAVGVNGNGGVPFVAINSTGFFLVGDQFTVGTPSGSYVFSVGQIFGIEIDFPNAVASIYIDNVLFGTVSNIDVTKKWTPVVGSYGCTLELNIGQKAFVYSRAGVTPWRS